MKNLSSTNEEDKGESVSTLGNDSFEDTTLVAAKDMRANVGLSGSLLGPGMELLGTPKSRMLVLQHWRY